MCGRFVRHSSLKLIEQTFNVDTTVTEAKPSYNIAPTQPVLAVIGNGCRRLVALQWGLVPFWARDRSIGNRMINARMETLESKPSFRRAFAFRRCLVVADGFYEWAGDKGKKTPWFITLTSGGPFGFAGLWETWKKEGEGEELRTCTIITAEAAPSLRNLHHRMPIVLKADAREDWLDRANQDSAGLKRLLADAHHRDFSCYPVGPRVNDVRNNDPGCMAPLS
jgi:putative SOS response-associated peptidase YedK